MKHIKKVINTVFVGYLLISIINAFLDYRAEPFRYGSPSGIVRLSLGVITEFGALIFVYALYRYIREKIEKRKKRLHTSPKIKTSQAQRY